MTAQTEEQPAEIVYNAHTTQFSEILEKLGCEYVDTLHDVEYWIKTKQDGRNEISVNYITGEIVVKKFMGNGRFLGKKTYQLSGGQTMEVAARAAVTV